MSQQGFDWKKLYLSADGRINRSTWWLKVWLPAMALNMAAFFIDFVIGGVGEYGYGIVGSLVGLLMIYPLVVTYIKRAHDRGRPGWFVLLLFVPIVNLWPMVELLFLRGTVGPNQYGPDPV